MKSLMSISEFQANYSVSRSTVYRLEDRGQIQFKKIGRAVRIPVDEAERWYANLPASDVAPK
jgi:excisionase family DNA binding protein